MKAVIQLLITFAILGIQVEAQEPISVEKIDTGEVWISPRLKSNNGQSFSVTVWFDKQLLGDGKAYDRRAKEFSNTTRKELRTRVIAALKKASRNSYKSAENSLKRLQQSGDVKSLKRHWIINGFSCVTNQRGLMSIAKIRGVSKIFSGGSSRSAPSLQKTQFVTNPNRPQKVSTQKLPWYISKIKADKVWEELGVTGRGTLNVVHDNNCIITPSLARTIYVNRKEIPGNGKDDDRNGLVDDYHGFNFNANNSNITMRQLTGDGQDTTRILHGTSCAQIISGAEAKNGAPQFGIAPMSKWAGVIATSDIEAAVEWAIEQGADTYSMSFSRPNLGEERSHWRKVTEHGSFCGLYFVSGAGNFAQSAEVPVQMRIPEDIPEAVFAAAGVHQDLSKTSFSSKGPVHWDTEHYQDGTVQKPEVCAFNHQLPLLLPDGTVQQGRLNGNSFAGPMLSGAISLMLSADPDLLPWDLKKIIISTTTDVSHKGVDYETGHGLINCYAAVKEVIKQRKIRNNQR